ncbi:succinate-CoA ligase [Heterostelium album PN500]|uniref:Succinate--CoA ligase [ADP-forming] subunit beta, mitochondrial n=1 Tax=Heterostelium pallidum (strain ATCC 26659 / Pp 5 / PN500) TaxID=670386 RepID=D3B6H9_HETP5|nr:succinate-CoA ligase [Heterostelium album PN500]EFA82949.1 succinate-CoA ligase [Heterostelium album PN500]|eukprot:XP_020435066.1 succinate-CoA ligase [Heterostelium album PN500]
MFSQVLKRSALNAFSPKQKATSSLVYTKRYLNVHEYQAQKMMRTYGIECPNGNVADTPEEAEKLAEVLNTQDLVVKAQILAGGRGKGVFSSGLKGGVHICNSPEEVKNYAKKMLGYTLVTKQTGPDGKVVNKIYIAERHYLRREMYFAILMDRKTGGPVMIASPEGGVDIETVARENPSAIFVEPIDIFKGVQPEQTARLAQKIGISPKNISKAQDQMQKLYNFFIKHDCTLVEINPLAETSSGDVLCMDAKLNFDDNAAFRQKEVFDLRDRTQEDPREVKASEYDLNYIGLDGSIGCLVNGAGLAMATMDIIKHYGGSPANFLDVGGGATQKQVTEAIKLISSDTKVKSILVNIFGGIMKCDIIALGIIAAVKELSIKTPLVVRLQGTNVESAKKIMEDSGLRLIAADDLDEAAEKAVRIADIVSLAEKADLDVSFKLPI